MKNLQLDRIEKVDIEVVKMRESSGNEQFFVRFSRNDCGDDFFGTTSKLPFACFQTQKNNQTREECLSRAWFEVGMAARFVGLESLSEVIIIGLSDEEKEIMMKTRTLFREKKKVD